MDHQCKVQVNLELGHRVRLREKKTSEDFTHDWTVFVRGPQTVDIQHLVEKVVFQLHESYPKAKRVCKEPPYEVVEWGSAGFLMRIEVHFKEKPKKMCFNYNLFLNPEGDHLRCETLTFNNPTREFRRKLIKAGGVMVVPKEAEAASRSSPDSPIPPHRRRSRPLTCQRLISMPTQTLVMILACRKHDILTHIHLSSTPIFFRSVNQSSEQIDRHLKKLRLNSSNTAVANLHKPTKEHRERP